MRTGEGFAGKTALVTGAAGGMGLEVSRRLCAESVRVYGVDKRAPDRDGTPAGAVFEAGDAGDEALMSALAARAFEDTGRLDYLVNAAGVLWFDRDTSLTAIDPDVWDEVLRINLTAAMIAARVALPHMRHTGGAMVPRLVDAVLPRGRPAAGCIPGIEGGAPGALEVHRHPVRRRRHSIQRSRPGPHPFSDAATLGREPGRGTGRRRRNSARTGRFNRRPRRGDSLSALRPRRLGDRNRADRGRRVARQALSARPNPSRLIKVRRLFIVGSPSSRGGTGLRRAGGARQARARKGRRACLVRWRRSLAASAERPSMH